MSGDRGNLQQIYENVIKDPNYAPYCGRCRCLVRMRKVEKLYWKCAKCPAVHDQRDFVPDGTEVSASLS